MSRIEAFVFDLDGTLVQSEKLKAASYAEAAVELRPEVDHDAVVEEFKEVVGGTRKVVATHLLEAFDLEDAARERMEEHGVQEPWQAYLQVRLDLYHERVRDPQVIRDHRWKHNIALLHWARRACSRVGLATSSHCKDARHVLEALDLEDTFDFVATADDVEEGKPHPEMYLLVADGLGVEPGRCVAIEDSPTGVRAALAAGMHVIAVTTEFTRRRVRDDGCLDERWIVDDRAELDDVVRSLLEAAPGD